MIRDVRDGDWPAILELANASVRHVGEAGPQDEWHINRQRFDTATRSQTQYVFDEDEALLGYGSVESDARGEFRMFLVTTSDRLSTVGDALYRRALDTLSRLGATRVWFTEYAADTPLLEFARRRGFSVHREHQLPNGVELLTLCKDLTKP